VDLAGPMELLLLWLIESTLHARQHSHRLHYLLKLSSIVKLEVHAKEETQWESMNSLLTAVFLKKLAKTIKPWILIAPIAVTFKFAKIAYHHHQALEKMEIVLQLPNSRVGKLLNTVASQEPIK